MDSDQWLPSLSFSLCGQCTSPTSVCAALLKPMILYRLSVTNFQLPIFNVKRTFFPLTVYFNFLNESHSKDRCLVMESPHANLLVGIA